MDKKIIAGIILGLVMIFWVAIETLSRKFSGLHIPFYIISIAAFAIFIFWLSKNKFFKGKSTLKETANYRLAVLENLEAFSIVSYALIFIGIFIISFGFFWLLTSQRADKVDLFLGTAIICVLCFLGVFSIKILKSSLAQKSKN